MQRLHACRPDANGCVRYNLPVNAYKKGSESSKTTSGRGSTHTDTKSPAPGMFIVTPNVPEDVVKAVQFGATHKLKVWDGPIL